ncbi:dehydrogenase [Nocardiopsis sp. TSRI0078]|uniref:NAD(P)-dependent oxidoreductase n=1 Tax=unclassified Nocardiopsis TaxID=2649073 RepID=UPI00093C6104|nr:NAD(P)-binding domain-containing protein [Nocardiopsis sp. TSRI0078]OKI15059.1 dehydrogenase [Nocardiopsis sp. TSRI0078]
MAEHTVKSRISLLGLGDMGTALARAWLAAGYPLTVWNRSPARTGPLAAEGADVAATAAEAAAASRLVVTCLLDDDSVGTVLADADLEGRDLFNVTTGTPGQARARAEWARGRGARFVSGGIMAVPPMIGAPDSGGYVFYSGSREAFGEHREALSAATGAVFVGEDAGLADLHDVALLSAMNGMFAGVAHAFALARGEDVRLREFAALLSDWLTAMTAGVHTSAEQLESGDYTTGVVSNLAMQVRGNRTLLRTAEEQGVSPALLLPYAELMERRLARGHGDEDGTGVVDLLSASRG